MRSVAENGGKVRSEIERQMLKLQKRTEQNKQKQVKMQEQEYAKYIRALDKVYQLRERTAYLAKCVEQLQPLQPLKYVTPNMVLWIKPTGIRVGNDNYGMLYEPDGTVTAWGIPQEEDVASTAEKLSDYRGEEWYQINIWDAEQEYEVPEKIKGYGKKIHVKKDWHVYIICLYYYPQILREAEQFMIQSIKSARGSL